MQCGLLGPQLVRHLDFRLDIRVQDEVSNGLPSECFYVEDSAYPAYQPGIIVFDNPPADRRS